MAVPKQTDAAPPRVHFQVEVLTTVTVFAVDFQTAADDAILIVKKQTTQEQQGMVLSENVTSVVKK